MKHFYCYNIVSGTMLCSEFGGGVGGERKGRKKGKRKGKEVCLCMYQYCSNFDCLRCWFAFPFSRLYSIKQNFKSKTSKVLIHTQAHCMYFLSSGKNLSVGT